MDDLSKGPVHGEVQPLIKQLKFGFCIRIYDFLTFIIKHQIM
jgi:hypothetical protein